MTHTPIEITITPMQAVIDGSPVLCENRGERMLTELYHQCVGNYPKFFKMDLLSRLGFIGTEMLLQKEGRERFVPAADRAIVFGNRQASIKNDRDYLATISDSGNYYPSPALFVYTLPNIVTGEIAIRNQYYGETCFYILNTPEELMRFAELTLATTLHTSVLAGWVECTDENHFYANIKLIWKN